MTSGLPAPATLFPHPVFRDNQCLPPRLFRRSSLRRDKYSPPPQLFPQFSPRRDKYVPPPRPFPPLQSASRQIHSASATISAIQPINLVVVPKLYNTNYTLFSQIYFPTNTSPAPPSSITTLPHPFLHHYPLSDYFHPNLHSISFTRHAIFSPPPDLKHSRRKMILVPKKYHGLGAFHAQNDASPERNARTRCISCPK